MAHDGFRGVFPDLVSPIDERGRVKNAVLTRLVNDLIDARVHGLTPLGSTGEFAYLNQRSDLTLPAIERLAKVDNIRYLKDASSDTGRLLGIINAVTTGLRSRRAACVR